MPRAFFASAIVTISVIGATGEGIKVYCFLVLKPRIIFFDEATSALNNRTQAIVSESLDKLKVTRIAIALVCDSCGTTTRAKLPESVNPSGYEDSIKSCLQEAANYEVGYKEKTPFAKTVRTCRQILKVKPALW